MAHVCIGMHLARFGTPFDRLRGLRLDPDVPDPYIAGMFFRSTAAS